MEVAYVFCESSPEGGESMAASTQEALREHKGPASSHGNGINPMDPQDEPVDVAVPGCASQLTLTLPPVATDAVKRVLAETGDPAGEMFAKALGLYMLALAARRQGKFVGSADSADVLETEFTGF